MGIQGNVICWVSVTFGCCAAAQQAVLCMQISTAEIRAMEKEEAWEPTGRVPVLDEDILEVWHPSTYVRIPYYHKLIAKQ